MSASNRGATRSPGDFYRTPAWAVEPILVELPVLDVTDAGCGDGAITAVLLEWWSKTNRVVGIEASKELAEATRDRFRGSPVEHRLTVRNDDFLKTRVDTPMIIANPPYSMAEAFVHHALEQVRAVNGTVAMLLRLNWMAGIGRERFHRQHPSDVFVLPKRPSFTGNGTDATDYAWLVWGPGRGGRWSILDVRGWDRPRSAVSTDEGAGT